MAGQTETSAPGELFLYNEAFGYAAFEFSSGTSSSSSSSSLAASSGDQAVVCIGGLTDGLLSLRYLPQLAPALASLGWRVIQPVLRSSYSGWGYSTLTQDAEDIDLLLEHLFAKRGVQEVVLLGHSTGCQDAVKYMEVGKHRSSVRGVVLQAPVSDREALALTNQGSDEEFRKQLEKYSDMAKRLIAEGKGDEILPRAASLLMGPPHPISAYRFDSLAGRMTEDDYFSSDLSDSELKQRLGHIVVPVLFAISADDEYVPRSVDSQALGLRLAAATGSSALKRAEVMVIEHGGHALREPPGAAESFVARVQGFVCRLAHPDLPVLSWEVSAAQEIRRRASAAAAAAAAAAASAGAAQKKPFMVAISGMPGVGKSTSAQALGRLLGEDSIMLPMDGFHTPMADLQARADAADATYRRGAPDTFDVPRLRQVLDQVVQDPPEKSVVPFPGFDHAAQDPAPEQYHFRRETHKIVVMEGLYLLHEADGWNGIPDYFDFKLYVDADIDEAIAAVKERNKVLSGYTPEELAARCDRVDRRNAETVQTSKVRADLVVQSTFLPLTPPGPLLPQS